MRKLLSQVLITPTNYRRIVARITPIDQRLALRAGIIISHYAFTTPQGQPGYGLISHTTRRAGVCIADAPSLWGAWSEQTGTLTGRQTGWSTIAWENWSAISRSSVEE